MLPAVCTQVRIQLIKDDPPALHTMHNKHVLLKDSNFENIALLERDACGGQRSPLYKRQVLDVLRGCRQSPVAMETPHQPNKQTNK